MVANLFVPARAAIAGYRETFRRPKSIGISPAATLASYSRRWME